MPAGRESRPDRNPDEPAFGSGARTPDADAAADPASTAVWKAPAGTDASLGGEDDLMKDPTPGSLGGDELFPGDPHANSLEAKPYLTGDHTGDDTTAQILDTIESMDDI